MGFRSIVWFLTILSGVCPFCIPIFLPKTIHTIAGNSTVPLHRFQKTWICCWTSQKEAKENFGLTSGKKDLSWKDALAHLGYLAEQDAFIPLLSSTIVYTVWSIVTPSTTSLFEARYWLNSLEVDLSFLSNGYGCK
jgi:hypothetical protein